jgi:regulator of protease activity HflC (stomatin/prohibitin superfamily)
MFLIIVGIIILVGTFAVAAVAVKEYGDDGKGLAALLRGIGVATFIGTSLLSCIYSQDAGEVIVLRNLGGSLAGYTEEAGFHLKAPWQSTISYDVRNNLVNLYRDAEYRYDGGAAEGSCVTVNDKGGASADIDLQVVYSLDADAAVQLYVDYGTQEHLTSAVIQNDVRATAREVAGRYDTMTMLTNRGEFTKGMTEALGEKWKKLGLDVEQVSVQDIRYPETITSRYAEAQAAETAKQKALNDQETAKVQAETKRIEAEGEANANRVISESLTPEVLQQRYIEALESIGEHGNLVVVPEGSQPLVSTTN